MSYDVVVGELRSAAGEYRSMVTPIACYSFPHDNATPDSLGHVELAAWLTAVVDQCRKAGAALHDGALDVAESLQRTAADYEQTDQGSAQGFRAPYVDLLGNPYGTFGPPPIGPVAPAGPPANPFLGGPR